MISSPHNIVPPAVREFRPRQPVNPGDLGGLAALEETRLDHDDYPTYIEPAPKEFEFTRTWPLVDPTGLPANFTRYMFASANSILPKGQAKSAQNVLGESTQPVYTGRHHLPGAAERDTE